MMNNFVYDIPVKVYFGEGQLCHLGDELGKFGIWWRLHQADGLV